MNRTPSEVSAIVGVIDPDAYSAATYTTDYIDMKYFRRYMAVVTVGDIASTGTVDAKLIAYTSGAGAGATDISGAGITQLTQAGTDSNKQVIINLNAQTLAGSTKFTHFKLQVVVGTAAADMGAVVLGFDPLYGPASDNDLSTVDEIVTA